MRLGGVYVAQVVTCLCMWAGFRSWYSTLVMGMVPGVQQGNPVRRWGISWFPLKPLTSRREGAHKETQQALPFCSQQRENYIDWTSKLYVFLWSLAVVAGGDLNSLYFLCFAWFSVPQCRSCNQMASFLLTHTHAHRGSTTSFNL